MVEQRGRVAERGRAVIVDQDNPQSRSETNDTTKAKKTGVGAA